MNIYLQLFLTFFEIGAISFGGGYGMIPMIRQKCLANGWFTEEGIVNFIAVAESTPGPIAVNMATYVGSTQAGFLGALLSVLGVILPSFIIILLICLILKNFLNLIGVKWAMNGIKAVIIGLILSASITIFLSLVFGLTSVKDNFSFDHNALIILSIIALFSFIYTKIRKTKPSPILLIIISAPLGILFYGLL